MWTPLNSKGERITWEKTFLHFSRAKRNIFTQQEKSLSYLVSHRAFCMGSFHNKFGLDRHNSGSKRIINCKFCRHPKDTSDHLFLHCPVSHQIKIKLERYVASLLKQPIQISPDTLLHNDIKNSPADLLILKMLCLYKRELYQHKLSLDIENVYLTDKTTFVNEILWKIKTKFKTFIANLDPDRRNTLPDLPHP